MKNLRVEIFFVILTLIFGAALIIITPIGAGTDEETHLARIWEMSKGAVIPNQYLSTGPFYPFTFYELSYRRDVNINPVTLDTWRTQLTIKIDWNNMLDLTTRARYFPTFYLLQAFIMGVLGRLLDTPVAIIYYVERFSYLISYALLVYLAIRITPVGKWVFGVLAVAPMSLILASTISVDSINNGIAFVFTAWILYMANPQKQSDFSRKDWAITALLIFAVSTLKLNAFTIFPILLLIPRSKLGPPKWLAALIVWTAINILFIGLGWNFLTSNFLLNSETKETFSAANQLQGILADPQHFFSALAYNILTLAPRYLRDWIGVSGYDYWALPGPVYLLTPILLLMTLFSDGTGEFLDRKKRIYALAIFFFAFVATWVLFFLLYSPPGSLQIPGVQGRYFIFIGPLLMLSLMPARPLFNINKIWLQAGSILLAVMTVGGLFLAYHVTCGSTFYTPGLCVLPAYKNWAPESSLSLEIPPAAAVTQTFTPACDELQQVRIWINQKGQASLSIKTQMEGSPNPVFLKQIPQAEIPSSGWLLVDFPVVTGVAHKKLSLEIYSNSDQVSQAVKLGYFDRDEYPEGKLSVNNQFQSGDLLFKYGCRGSLEKLFP